MHVVVPHFYKDDLIAFISGQSDVEDLIAWCEGRNSNHIQQDIVSDMKVPWENTVIDIDKDDRIRILPTETSKPRF